MSDSGAESVSLQMSRMRISGEIRNEIRGPTAGKNKNDNNAAAAPSSVEGPDNRSEPMQTRPRKSVILAAGHQSQSRTSSKHRPTPDVASTDEYRVHVPKSESKPTHSSPATQNTSQQQQDSSGESDDNPTNARIAWPEKYSGNHDEALEKFLKRQERMGIPLTDRQKELLDQIKKQKNIA